MNPSCVKPDSRIKGFDFAMRGKAIDQPTRRDFRGGTIPTMPREAVALGQRVVPTPA